MKPFLQQLWMILTLDCEGSAQLSSDSLDRKLFWYEVLAVKLHCMICKKSRILDRQLIQLGQQLNQASKTDGLAKLSGEARNRIRNRISELPID